MMRCYRRLPRENLLPKGGWESFCTFVQFLPRNERMLARLGGAIRIAHGSTRRPLAPFTPRRKRAASLFVGRKQQRLVGMCGGCRSSGDAPLTRRSEREG